VTASTNKPTSSLPMLVQITLSRQSNTKEKQSKAIYSFSGSKFCQRTMMNSLTQFFYSSSTASTQTLTKASKSSSSYKKKSLCADASANAIAISCSNSISTSHAVAGRFFLKYIYIFRVFEVTVIVANIQTG
jgi:hypothetical protein